MRKTNLVLSLGLSLSFVGGVALFVAPAPVSAVGENSHAMGLWSPNTKYDTCTKAVHDSYKVLASDGKYYPTWHPPVHKFADGKTCTFGHEHGRDPRGSKLWPFIQEHFAFDANKNGKIDADELKVSGLPFGFANEQLDVYSKARGEVAMRHEDHVGHKNEWENDLALNRTVNGVRQTLKTKCSFMMKVHQGTHSVDAFSNNVHEVQYFVECDDGVKLAATKLVPFGKPNELTSACNKKTLYKLNNPLAAKMPTGGGIRFIPTRECVLQYFLVPTTQFTDIGRSLYEDWVSSNYLRTSGGKNVAYYDPHFAVFGPSRYYDPSKPDGLARSVDLCYEVESNGDRPRNGNCDSATNYGKIKGIKFDDPRSPFNGVKREFYFNQTWIDNANGPTAWYTDPWGGRASTTKFTGSIKQYVSKINNYNKVILESQAIGANRNYGGQGVHAPN